jgi:hypothetical protein
MRRAVLVNALALCLLIGCDRSYKRDGDLKKQPVTKALKLLDQGRVDEAAFIFEELHDRHPENNELSVGLASAYAAMAGLKIAAYYDLFSEALFNRPLVDLQGKTGSQKYRSLLGRKDLSTPDRFQSPQKAAAELTFNRLRESLLMCLQLGELLDKFPKIPDEKVMFVNEAITILENLYQPQKAHHGFRAVLRATLFKADLVRRFSKDEPSKGCDINAIELVGNFSEVDRQLTVLLRDLGQAYPKEKSQLNKASERFHQVVQGLEQQIQSNGIAAFQESLSAYLLGTGSEGCSQ